MFTEERYNIILQELNAKGIVSVTELVELLDASESTIRRDLNSLHNDGMLKKFMEEQFQLVITLLNMIIKLM